MGITTTTQVPLHLQRLRQKVDGSRNIPKWQSMGGVMERLGKVVVKRIKRNLSGPILHRRSSDLHNSWDFVHFMTSKGWTMVAGSDIPYARIHDTGGFAGAGHKVRIPKRAYVRKSVVQEARRIRKIMERFITKIVRNR